MTNSNPKHPIQPVVKDENGVLRFKENKIVRLLLDNGELDLNKLAAMGFSKEDRQQFAQLIGYSLCGYADLSYMDEVVYETATRMYKTGETEEQARIKHLTVELESLREGLRPLVSRLFGNLQQQRN